MQAGKQVRNATPRADEGRRGHLIEGLGKRSAKLAAR